MPLIKKFRIVTACPPSTLKFQRTGCYYLLFAQNTGDLAGAISLNSQSENQPHYRRSLRVLNELPILAL